jgi:predicted permease
MSIERIQLRLLFRISITRMIDLDLLAADGEGQNLIARLLSILAAFSFALAFLIVPRYATSTLSLPSLARAAWSDEEFLLSTTIAVAGLFAVLAWNAVFPNKRDALILGPLPLRTRTVVLAKLSAMGTGLATVIVAVNAFTGVAFPITTAAGVPDALRSLAAWWFTAAAAGAFVFFGAVALQGAASQVLPWHSFLKVSGLLQSSVLFGLIGLFFLSPSFTPTLNWIPSFWFTGLLHVLRGDAIPVFLPLAVRAIHGLLITAGLAAIIWPIAWFRNARRMVEAPDIMPAGRWRYRFPAILLPSPLDRAILHFIARTIARSRQHRLLISLTCGIGFAVTAAFSRSFLQGIERRPWSEPNIPMMNAGALLLFFAIVGLRAIFILPVALPANWVFRITEVQSAADYLASVRKALILTGVAPILLVNAVFCFLCWPPLPASEHILVLTLAAVLMLELSMYQFSSIPFTCSWIPAAANQRMRLGLRCILFLIFSNGVVSIELWSMERPVRFAAFLTILLAAAGWAYRRRADFVASDCDRIQFDQVAPAEVFSLGLSTNEQVHLHTPVGENVDDEIALHISMAVADRVARGEAPENARLAVLHEFGNIQLVREDVRAVWNRTTLEQFVQDLRAGLRILRKSPAFSVAAVALIAVGIGGNVTIFSMIHALLTRPAPGVTAERLVAFGLTKGGRPDDPGNSFPNYVDYVAQTRTMGSLVAYWTDRMTMALPDGSYEVRGQLVTPNYFRTLGVPLAMGRSFTPDEARGASGLVAVIAWHVWQKHFHSEPDILGRSMVLNGFPATIIGVTVEGFHGVQFTPNFEIGVPALGYLRTTGREFTLTDRTLRPVGIIGQLAPDVSLAEAQTEFKAISLRLAAAYPDVNKEQMVVLAPYTASAFGLWQSPEARLFMSIFAGVGWLSLLVVCANVANLMLGRAVSRQREMAVRQSLGGSRLRILRLLLGESLVLSLLATVAAGLFAWWVSHAVIGLIPPLESGARIAPDLTPDWSVAAYGVLLALVSAFVFTLAPTLCVWRQQLLPWLKAGQHGVVQGRSHLARFLVIVQLALCAVLLTGAGLAGRSLHLINNTDLHFDKNHLLIVRVSTSVAARAGPENIALLERLRERLQTVPGIVSASYASAVPPNPFGGMWSAMVRTPGGSRAVAVRGLDVGAGYLQTLGVHGVTGRGITSEDISRGGQSAVVTQQLAGELWPGGSPLGQTMYIDGQSMNVVGIAPDGAYAGILAEGGNNNFVFLPEREGADRPGVRFFHLRYAGKLEVIGPAIRAAVRETDPRIPVSGIHTIDTELDSYTAPLLVIATLPSCFSAGSLIVAAIGLYAIVSFHTARRTRDFGIRMSVGASAANIVTSVLREGLILAAIGCGTGIAIAAAATRILRSFLFGVNPLDVVTYAVVASLLALISLLACYVPARRAGRIHPMEALRQE